MLEHILKEICQYNHEPQRYYLLINVFKERGRKDVTAASVWFSV